MMPSAHDPAPSKPKWLVLAAFLATAVACCTPLWAQQPAKQPPAEGDLIPRAGTLMYMVSDRPDVLYRLFGTDKKGGWRLRNLTQQSLNDEFKNNPDSDEARRAQAILDYIFGSYEAMEQVEIGLVDVTLDGPKYLVHVRLKPGKKVDLKPAFLSEYLSRTFEYRNTRCLLYRVDTNGPVNPEETPKDPGEPNPGEKGPGPRPTNYFGMNRYYVAEAGSSILISNFESTMREAIDRWHEPDPGESLSGRPEFLEWRTARKKHDLSVFVVGREIQNLIERLLPSKEQAGVDAPKIYSQIDSWLQFREYRYVVFDMDYEESVRGVTLAATLKTRRPTRLLEKFAIESRKFTALRYVPAGAVVTLGAQLGDARQTWGNLLELARDLEKVGTELESSGFMPWGRRDREPDSIEPRKPDTPEKPRSPDDDNPWLPKNVGPLRMLGDLGELLNGQAREPEAKQTELDKALAELDKALAEFGTSTDELLSVLGEQVIAFAAIDPEAAKARYRRGMLDLVRAGSVGVVIHLRDPKKAAEIIQRAREKDPQGVFRGMEAVGYQGVTFHVSPERPYGYAITKDALLISVTMADSAEEGTAPLVASLKSMVDASLKGERAGFTAEGSKFLEIDWGAIARIERESIEANMRRLDRFARPPLDANVNAHMTDFTFALRTREAKDGIELAMRITGLPDFGAMFEDTKALVFEGGGADREAFSYTEENLRAVNNVLRRKAEDGAESFDLAELVKSGALRAGHLQTPFDARWTGGRGNLGWTTLDQIKRDEDGKLPSWVNAETAATIEANEKAGWCAFRLAPGNVAAHVRDYTSGMIVLYQEKADTLGGHFVLYADGQFGWLHGSVLAQALKLNAEGKPVPAMDEVEDGGHGQSSGKGAKEANPWLPGSGDNKESAKPPPPPRRPDGDGIDRPTD